jgi:hypothetical protein
MTGSWRKLHTEELHDLYSSPNIIMVIESQKMRWTGHVAHMREMRNMYKILVGKPEENRLLIRPRCRWEVNININLGELEWEGVDWIHLAHDTDWR